MIFFNSARIEFFEMQCEINKHYDLKMLVEFISIIFYAFIFFILCYSSLCSNIIFQIMSEQRKV